MRRGNVFVAMSIVSFVMAVCALWTVFSYVTHTDTLAAEENAVQANCEAETAVIEAEEQAETTEETVEVPQEAVCAPVRDDDDGLGPDLMLLAKVIQCEAGSEWISAEQKYNAGSVVLNRVADPRFPGNIYDVVWQAGQYSCATSGALFMAEPTEEVIDIARDLLLGGSRLPADVVWQAEFPQGEGVYSTYYDEVLGTTTYYCY